VAGQHSGALVVNTGVACINGATVAGPVTVSAGATLIATHATIRGAVTATGAASVELIGTTVEGEVHIGGTTGSLTLFGSTLNRDVVLDDNRTRAAPLFAGNRLGGTLTCGGSGAAPVNLGAPNTVRGAVAGPCPVP
jgi:hypothetical protein